MGSKTKTRKTEIMKKYFFLSLSMTAIAYLLVSFVRFDIAWISKVGNWEQYERFLCILGYLMKECVTVLIYIGNKLNK